MIALFDKDSDRQWDEYVYGHSDSNLYHLSGWRRVAEASYGARDISLVAKDNGRIRGILPLLEIKAFKKGSYLTSGIFGAYNGILADSEQFHQELLDGAKSICQERGGSFLTIKEKNLRDYPDLAAYNGYSIFTMELVDDPDKVWSSLKDKVRNQVRKAKRSGLSVEYDPAGLADFLNIYAANMHEMGTPFLGAAFFKVLLEVFAKESQIILVRLGKNAVAGGILLRFKDTAYMPFASALRRFNHFCPNNILYWEAIKASCLKGCKEFDFGRSTADSGSYNFKKQWALNRQLYYYYFPKKAACESFNPNEAKYRMCIRLWRLLPLRAANMLGPRIIKFFL